MSKCKSCGKDKQPDDPVCPHCNAVDNRAMMSATGGTPLLTLLILGLLGVSIYRFIILGWAATTGNIRITALAFLLLGITGLIFNPLWSFGIKNRKTAVIMVIVSAIIFLIFNSV